jgi:hypothetical protein
MKKLIVICAMLIVSVTHTSLGCDTPVSPSISGPGKVLLNKTYSYTIVMDPVYKQNAGGYTNTEWSFEGIGVVGYGETFILNTTGWHLAYGTYLLTAKNQFGGSHACFGCMTNTTFTYKVEITPPPKPELSVDSPTLYTAPPPEYIAQGTARITLKVYNRGEATSPPPTVKIYWSRNRSISGAFAAGSITYSDQIASNTASSADVTINIPALSSGETWAAWYCILVVDPNNSIAESDETNNTTDNYMIKIKSSSGRVAMNTSEDGLVEITDMTGNIAWKKGAVPLNFSEIEAGMYIYKSLKDGRITLRKVVKQ